MKAIHGIRGWWFPALFCVLSPSLGQAALGPLRADSDEGEPAGKSYRSFAFKRPAQGELKIHIHFPPDWKSSDRRPAMVFFFGGAWKQGSVEQFTHQAEYFARRGMVTARADYRVASRHNVTPDRCVEDARSAIRWLRARSPEFGIDPNRIVGSGGSAGGHLAACAALLKGPDDPGDDVGISCRPNALVLFNPVVDLAGVGGEVLDANGRDLKDSLSPLRFLSSGAPPVILFYGTRDRFLEAGLAMVRQAKELGIRAEGYTAAEQPHGFFNRSPWREVTMRQADEFLSSLSYLSGPPTVELPPGSPVLKLVR